MRSMRANRSGLVQLVTAVAILGVIAVYETQKPEFTPADNQHIGANVTVSGPKVPIGMRAVEQANSSTPVLANGHGPVVAIGPYAFLGTFQLQFASPATDSDTPVFVASRLFDGGNWDYQRAYTDSSGLVTIGNPGHAFYWPFAVDFDALLADYHASFADQLHIAVKSHGNGCALRQESKTDGYSADQIGSSAFSTCFYTAAGKRYLRLINNLPLPMRVTDHKHTTYLLPGASMHYPADLAEGTWKRLLAAYDTEAATLHELHTAITALMTIIESIDPKFNHDQFIQNYHAAFEQMSKTPACAYARNAFNGYVVAAKLTMCLTTDFLRKLFRQYTPLAMSFIATGELSSWTEYEMQRQSDVRDNPPNGQILIMRTS